jgi:hypothetical protein
MAEVKNEHRFYGRVPGGNALLAEADIARLYERRRSVEQAVDAVLEKAIDAAPLQIVDGRGDFHLVIRPLLSDHGLRGRAGLDDQGEELKLSIRRTHSQLRFSEPWEPDLLELLSFGIPSITLAGISITNNPVGAAGRVLEDYFGNLDVAEDCTTRFFRSAMATRFARGTGSEESFVLRDGAMFQLTAHLALMVGTWLERGGYRGPVDVLAALRGAQGAESGGWHMPAMASRVFLTRSKPALFTNDYRAHTRRTVDQLVREPTETASILFERLIRVIRRPPLPDPLQLAN